MLVSEYEAFHMKNNESISEMYAKLTLITNDLKSLGKTYSKYELIRKIFRSLTSVWHTEATVIEKPRNLFSTTVDELIGSLMTYELKLKKTKKPEPSKKS